MDDRLAALERENEQLKEQLKNSEGLIALGELAGTTTHEFNNIIMTVMNYAKLGLRHKDDAMREKAFNIILEASQKAAKVTQCILGQARNRSQELEPTDLVALTDDAMLLLERELNKYKIQFEKDYESNVPKIMARGNQIQQVIFNLVINARQAMPDGGRLQIRIGFDEKDNQVVWQVRDWGTGIPEDVLPHIFEPFFTTKKGPDASGKGGTGVGLASCKEIIQKHGGKIRVDSAVGKGTAFTLRFPAVKE
ncbi:MAG: sensor histidine kinase [Thermoguttaceae bacterium]|nr:sensor histidine kinase [Thermoguttaceae bacterium]